MSNWRRPSAPSSHIAIPASPAGDQCWHTLPLGLMGHGLVQIAVLHRDRHSYTTGGYLGIGVTNVNERRSLEVARPLLHPSCRTQFFTRACDETTATPKHCPGTSLNTPRKSCDPGGGRSDSDQALVRTTSRKRRPLPAEKENRLESALWASPSFATPCCRQIAVCRAQLKLNVPPASKGLKSLHPLRASQRQ